VRSRGLTTAQTRHDVVAQLHPGAEHLLSGLDELVRRDPFVDRAQHLVGARLKAQVDARESCVVEQRELLGRAPRQRPRAPVRRHLLDSREARLHARDDGGQLLRPHGARVRVLQEHRPRPAAQEQLHLVGLGGQLARQQSPACAALDLRRPPSSIAEHLGRGRHGVDIGEHVGEVAL